MLIALPFCCLNTRTTRPGAHHSEVVLRAHERPVFTTSPKPESSEDVVFAHSRKLKIDRRPVLEHGVAVEKVWDERQKEMAGVPYGRSWTSVHRLCMVVRWYCCVYGSGKVASNPLNRQWWCLHLLLQDYARAFPARS